MSSNDEPEIIDVEAEEIVDGSNLPAVVEHSWQTYRSDEPIEAQRDWPHGPSPERRCVAHRKNGDQCKNAAIKGATVCRYHGGAAKHVKRAARARLDNAADLMAKQLLGIALTADSEAVMLAAVRDALDRAGLKAPSEVVLSQGEPKPYEVIFDRIGGTPSGEFPSASRGYDQAGLGRGVADAGTAFAPTQPHTADQTQPPGHAEPRNQGIEGAEGVESAFDASSSEGSEPSDHALPRQGRPHQRDRDRQRQPRVRHITGEDAMRLANEANRAIGAMPDQLALESHHKRYPRP
jgi:hypothetical protein